MRILISIVILASLATSADALNNRSAVSINGLDTNACTTTSPCRSFSAALLQTAVDGEIIALTTAGYGPFTVDRSLTISGAPGIHAAITVTSGDGIRVDAGATDRVVIRNLVLLGNPGSNGVDVLVAGEVRVIGCYIQGFPSAGIGVRQGNLSVDDCVIADSGIGVAVVNSTPASSALRVTITNSLVDRSFNYGVLADQGSSVAMVNTTVTGANSGVLVQSVTGTGALAAAATIEGCVIAHNVNDGVLVSASGGNNTATAFISHNLFDHNGFGAQTSSSGVIYSFANNRFVDNSSASGPFTPASFQ